MKLNTRELLDLLDSFVGMSLMDTLLNLDKIPSLGAGAYAKAGVTR